MGPISQDPRNVFLPFNELSYNKSQTTVTTYIYLCSFPLPCPAWGMVFLCQVPSPMPPFSPHPFILLGGGLIQRIYSLCFQASIFFSFSCTTQLVGSWFPTQGLNPCPQQYKCGVIITGLPDHIFTEKTKEQFLLTPLLPPSWQPSKLIIVLCLSGSLVILWYETLVLAPWVWSLSVGEFSIAWLQRDPCLSPLLREECVYPLHSGHLFPDVYLPCSCRV